MYLAEHKDFALAYLVGGEFVEQGLGLLVGYSRVDNNIITLVPVSRSGNAVLVTELQRIDYSNNLILIICLIIVN